MSGLKNLFPVTRFTVHFHSTGEGDRSQEEELPVLRVRFGFSTDESVSVFSVATLRVPGFFGFGAAGV